MNEKLYTVILMYPDYATDTFGETYLAHVEAYNRERAVFAAQNNCVTNSDIEVQNLDDLFVVAVFSGHLEEV